MERLDFFVQGSADEPYRVQFVRDGLKIVGLCDCPAGENGQYCKHRIGILTGDTKICGDLDGGAVATVQSWLPGSELERVLAEVAAAERDLAAAQALVKTRKKQLARVLYGHG